MAPRTRTNSFVADKFIEARSSSPLEFLNWYCLIDINDYINVLSTPGMSPRR
ncbi:MAG: hypothetical protein IIT36_04590 [Aeriscardovia sp.]|nr:hypothetical protein [Aeriscardovia sp.]